MWVIVRKLKTFYLIFVVVVVALSKISYKQTHTHTHSTVEMLHEKVANQVQQKVASAKANK